VQLLPSSLQSQQYDSSSSFPFLIFHFHFSFLILALASEQSSSPHFSFGKRPEGLCPLVFISFLVVVTTVTAGVGAAALVLAAILRRSVVP
jgi:hypothetical protein